MGTMASQITSLTIVYSTIYAGADRSKHQSSTSLAFVRGIHRGPVNSPHKWPVMWKLFPFDNVIMHKWLSLVTTDAMTSKTSLVNHFTSDQNFMVSHAWFYSYILLHALKHMNTNKKKPRLIICCQLILLQDCDASWIREYWTWKQGS